MKNIELCAVCQVPLLVSRELQWESNGVISLTSSPLNRMISFEADALDEIFKGIEKLIGMPIGHLVVESRSRETRRYIERILPPEARKALEGRGGKEESEAERLTPEGKRALFATMRSLVLNLMDIGIVYGYGAPALGDLWGNGVSYPWRVQVVRNPYSLLFTAADNLGSAEAIEGAEMQVRYVRIGKDTYKTEVYPGKHPVELKEKLRRRHRYDFKPGNIAYERCPGCGIPQAIARRSWDIDAGTITDPDTKRRLALFGPYAVDSIFDDLQEELGDAIPETVIEATRRYIKVAWDVEEWNRDGLNFQQLAGISGLGNLVHFHGDRNHLDIVIENACFHLPMVGTVQALVELAYRVKSSSVEWELAEDGDLSLIIKVR